jgi:hypothetical protein
MLRGAGSADRQRQPSTPSRAVSNQSKASEPKEHHRPGRWFGDATADQCEVGYGANVSPGVSDVHEELSSWEHSKLVFSYDRQIRSYDRAVGVKAAAKEEAARIGNIEADVGRRIVKRDEVREREVGPKYIGFVQSKNAGRRPGATAIANPLKSKTMLARAGAA